MRDFTAGLMAVLLLPVGARAVDTTTVFNEVMYHPAATDQPEWIELHNEMAVNMDLTGWRLTGGVNFTFPANTTISAGGYLVVASNPSALQASAGITGVLGPWTGSLDNGSETITLRNAIDREMDDFRQTELQFTTLVDDGAVFFLNGVEVTRVNMATGAADGTTRAASEVQNATVSAPLVLPGANLVQGANVLSVSVHRERRPN